MTKLRHAVTFAALCWGILLGGFALAESYLEAPTGASTPAELTADGGLNRAGPAWVTYLYVDGGADLKGLSKLERLSVNRSEFLDGGLDVMGQITNTGPGVEVLVNDGLRVTGRTVLDAGSFVAGELVVRGIATVTKTGAPATLLRLSSTNTGSTSPEMQGIYMTMVAGGSGATTQPSFGHYLSNNVVGTAATWSSGNGVYATEGMHTTVWGASTLNIGSENVVQAATTNIGTVNFASVDKAGGTNIGSASIVRNTTGTEIGGWFGLHANNNSVPVWGSSAALVADNYDSTSNILSLRDGNTAVLEVRDGNRWIVNGDAGFAAASLVTNGAAGTVYWRAPSYAGLYEENESGTTIDVLPDAGTYFQWTTTTAGVVTGAPMITSSVASDNITIGAEGAGVYHVSAHVSGSNTSASSTVVHIAVFVDGVRQPNCTASGNLASGDKDVISVTCLLSLVAGKVVDLRFTSANPANDPIIYHANLNLERTAG